MSEAAEIVSSIGAGIQCSDIVPTAFGLFVASGGDPWTSIKCAINMGGDTDTLGAIVGAISGAFKGVNALPLNILKEVEEASKLDLKTTSKNLLTFIKKKG